MTLQNKSAFIYHFPPGLERDFKPSLGCAVLLVHFLIRVDGATKACTDPDISVPFSWLCSISKTLSSTIFGVSMTVLIV